MKDRRTLVAVAGLVVFVILQCGSPVRPGSDCTIPGQERKAENGATYTCRPAPPDGEKRWMP